MKSILGRLLESLGDAFGYDFGTKIRVSGRLGASWRRLGASWKRLGQRLEASCRVCRVLERLGARLGVVSPFSGGPEGFERQVRGSLPAGPLASRGAKKASGFEGTGPFPMAPALEP